MISNEDEKLLLRVQQILSNLRIINVNSPDEVIMMRMEASFLLEKFHEFRERVIHET